MKKDKLSSVKNINANDLRKIIREELARGIPDYAFNQPTDEALRLLADYFKATLIKHVNHTVQDSSIRNRKYAAASRAAASIVNDKELKKVIEEKLKEKLLIFLDEGR